MHAFLVHHEGDHVGVAIRDVVEGERINGNCMDTGTTVEVEARESIPFGHKIALLDMNEGHHVIEYRVQIGRALIAIPKGGYVHTHNLRSARWSGMDADATEAGASRWK